MACAVVTVPVTALKRAFSFILFDPTMPIYEYRCDSCGFQKEYIQRMSDPTLTDCPECKKATFSKMVTAAGFQLKGGGWYVTDFRNNGKGSSASTAKPESESGDPAGNSGAASTDSSAAAQSSPAPDSKPAAPAAT